MLTRQLVSKVGLMLVVMLSAMVVHAQTPTPNPDTLIEDCARGLKPDRPIATGADAPSIKIIAPENKTVVVSDQAGLVDVVFKVEVKNWKLPGAYTEEDAYHWHLWLNDSVWGMFYQTEALSGIPYGTWRMCATLGDQTHLDIGMPDAILLTVERRDAQTATVTITPASTPTATIPVTAQTEAEPLPASVILGLGVLAAAVGLLIGWRKSKAS